MDSPGTGYEIAGAGRRAAAVSAAGRGPAGWPARPAGGGARAPAATARTTWCCSTCWSGPTRWPGCGRRGAVDAATDVVAVHLDHGVPPGPELHRRLAAVGARAVADGRRWWSASTTRCRICRGARWCWAGRAAGKSVEAERRLAAFPDVVYVATGGTRDGDEDWAQRVSLHRERRPGSWRTRRDLRSGAAAGRGRARRGAPAPGAPAEASPLLIDCLALWLTHVMDEVGAWDDATWEAGGRRALQERTDALVAAVRATPRHGGGGQQRGRLRGRPGDPGGPPVPRRTGAAERGVRRGVRAGAAGRRGPGACAAWMTEARRGPCPLARGRGAGCS